MASDEIGKGGDLISREQAIAALSSLYGYDENHRDIAPAIEEILSLPSIAPDPSVADAAWKNILFLTDGPSPMDPRLQHVWQATLLREIRTFARASLPAQQPWEREGLKAAIQTALAAAAFADSYDTSEIAADVALSRPLPAKPTGPACPNCAKAEALAGAVEAFLEHGNVEVCIGNHNTFCGCGDSSLVAALAAWREGK